MLCHAIPLSVFVKSESMGSTVMAVTRLCRTPGCR